MSHVLLFGNLRSSLTLARSLAAAGHVIHCGMDEPDPYLITSRHVAGGFLHARPDLEPESALGSLLAYLGEHPEIDVVAPVSDIAVRLLSRRREAFPARISLLMASADVVETCIDKAIMFELCERLGVPLAPREIVADHQALLGAVGRIGRPCIVKPVDASHYLFDRKAIVLHEGDDAAALLPHWPAEHGTLCVQRFVGGFRHDISFVAHHGRLVGAVDCRVPRTDRADGTGYTTELISAEVHPRVAQGVEALLAALGYTGVGDIEFMVDDALDEVSFIELNPRLCASFKSAEICGLPFSELMLQIGLGQAPEPRAAPWAHPVGRRIVWAKGEVSAFKRALSGEEAASLTFVTALGRLLRAMAARHHLTLALGDPVPSLWIYLHPLLRKFGFSPEGRLRLRKGAGQSAPMRAATSDVFDAAR